MYTSVLLCLEDTVFLESSTTSDSYDLPTLFCLQIPEPREERLDENILSAPTSLTLCPVVDFCVNSHALQKKVSLMVAK